jgi:hypothetical protein
MKTLPVEWQTFVARRKLDVKAWMSSNGIKTYAELVKHLRSKEIAPPPLTTVEQYFKKSKKPRISPQKAPDLPKEDLTVQASPDIEPVLAESVPVKKTRKKYSKKKVHNTKDD